MHLRDRESSNILNGVKGGRLVSGGNRKSRTQTPAEISHDLLHIGGVFEETSAIF